LNPQAIFSPRSVSPSAQGSQRCFGFSKKPTAFADQQQNFFKLKSLSLILVSLWILIEHNLTKIDIRKGAKDGK
jgi:hypothetical protein